MTAQLPAALIDFARSGSCATLRVHGELTDTARSYLADAVEWAVQPGIIQLLIEFDTPTQINPTCLELLRHVGSRLGLGQVELVVTVAST